MSFPALKNLGVNRPQEISGYTLSSTDEYDTLRIRYTRQKGSLLPNSKRFKFPRRPLGGVQQVNTREKPHTEVSPALNAALEELAHLLQQDQSIKAKKEILLKELSEFEEYVSTRVAEFKSEIENL